jgi:hypothetical protein
MYQNEKKIKRVTAKSAVGTMITEYTYVHNAIKTITITRDQKVQQKYTIFYPVMNCVPSGYLLSRQGAPEIIGTFTVDSLRVIKRVQVPDIVQGNVGNDFNSNSNKYFYDSLNRITQDNPGFAPNVFYDIYIFISYDAYNNVSNINAGFSTIENISNIQVDSSRNPFRQQNYLYYKIKNLPFLNLSPFVFGIDNVAYFLALNQNNVLKFHYFTSTGTECDFLFTYTYTADQYPLAIKVYKINSSEGGNPLDTTLQQELSIEYL